MTPSPIDPFAEIAAPQTLIDAADLPELAVLVAVLDDRAPATVRPNILRAAQAHPRFRPAPLSPVEALAAVVADVDALLGDLSAAEWGTADALGELSVRDTVSHLTGADRYLGVKTGAWVEPLAADELDHLAVSRPSIDAGRGLGDGELLARWRGTSAALIAHLRTLTGDDLARPSRYNVIEAPVGGVLVARAFELWTHAEDICRATGRPLRPPVAGVLGAMTDVAAELMPIGYQLEGGADEQHTLRLVLTGPGGGTWNRRLNPDDPGGDQVGAGDPDVVIVADAIEFCRLIAGRVEVADLDVELLGESAVGHAVLAGATRFAMD